jgi:ABC-type antimicrobial peptide transport system permease subunit
MHREAFVSWQLVLIIIAFVFAVLTGIPLGAAMSVRRARVLGSLGGIIGAALSAAGVYAYATSISVDPLSYALGAFGAATVGAVVGTLIVNFLVSLRDRRPTIPTEL